MNLLRRLRGEPRTNAPSQVTVEAVGFVRNGVRKPRPHGWERVESRLEVSAGHARRFDGIEGYSHLIVVFYMDLAALAPEKPESLVLASGNRYGIFATRSQLRPNHLGVSSVPLVRVERPAEGQIVLVVRGLDAVDGTPVLDVKPYLPEYDSHPGATIPPGRG
jgi:tRNA-Thr(GGU) m(6)t(6)A37 methyltransferase TsaA